MGSMQPELRERLGLGRPGAYTRAAGAEACGYGDDHSAQHCSQRLLRGMDTAPGQGNRFVRGLRDIGGGGADQRQNDTRECVVVSMTPVWAVMCCPQQSSSAEPCLPASKELRFERNRRRNRHTNL